MKKSAESQLKLNRRQLLRAAGVIVGVGWVVAAPGSRILAQARFASNPFTLGVASGDPLPDGVVLWTRLAPSPLGRSGEGIPDGMITVEWIVASDERLLQIVQRSTSPTVPELAHSVHVEASGLEPNTISSGSAVRSARLGAPKRPPQRAQNSINVKFAVSRAG